MFQVESYVSRLTELLRKQFDTRLLYVGLQGSYLRGEATENSDIDIMVIIDGLTVSDLEAYRAIIESLETPEKSCGFICSKSDLAHWNPLEICHVLHTTRDCYGILADHIPSYTESDIRNFVKFSLNGLYHGLCHGYIHANRTEYAASLPAMYKGVFFILQDLHYLREGIFVATKASLLERLTGMDHAVMERSLELNAGRDYDFKESFNLLFTWCQKTLETL